MTRFKVIGVRTQNGHITHLGIEANDGSCHLLHQSNVMQYIHDRVHSFYTYADNIPSEITICMDHLGQKYLRTDPQKTPSNNLLKLKRY